MVTANSSTPGQPALGAPCVCCMHIEIKYPESELRLSVVTYVKIVTELSELSVLRKQ